MDHPVLYSFRRCPYAMRARMAIAVAGIDVELREVVLREKPEQMLRASPKGTVPVLVLSDNEVIDESLQIMRWALSKADPQGWLTEGTHTADDLIAACDGGFKFHLDRYKYAGRYEGVVALEHREAAEGFLTRLQQQLDGNRYLFGPEPTLADYAIMPFLRQFANVDRKWFDATPYPELRAWLAAMLKSEIFIGAMEKHARWQAGQAPVLFPG